jgi:hypothetical protein
MRHPYYLDWQCCRCGMPVRTYLSSPRTVHRFAALLASDLVVCGCVFGSEDAGRDVSRPVVPAARGCTAAEPWQSEDSHTGPVLVKKTAGGER